MNDAEEDGMIDTGHFAAEDDGDTDSDKSVVIQANNPRLRREWSGRLAAPPASRV
jgi:hypothetical protein